MKRVIVQVKTFHQKFNWRKLDDISTSSQLNEFIRSHPEIKVIDIKPWNTWNIALTYEITEESNDVK